MRGNAVTPYTCDRCGQVEETDTGATPMGWRFLLPPQIISRSDISALRWNDICLMCDQSFDDWWNAPKETKHEPTGTVARGSHPRGLPERGVSDVSGGATSRPPKPPAPPKDREWDGT